MSTLDLYPHARRDDIETSHRGARSVDGEKNRSDVLQLFFQHGPMTHEGLVNAAGWGGVRQSPSGLRSRCHELVTAGLVRDSGRTARLRSGRQGTVWQLTEAAKNFGLGSNDRPVTTWTER